MNENLKVEFNGIQISDYFIVTKLTRNLGATRSNNLLKVGNSKGERFISTSIDSDNIKMNFAVLGNVIESKRELARILNVSEPKKLIFNDEPDKYYLAIPDDSNDISDERNWMTGQINWIIPDGVAHSISEEESTNENTPGTIIINNQGSEETYPTVEIKMQSENGFLAFINQDGDVCQIGNPDEIDGFDYEKSEKLFDDHFNVDKGWLLNEGVTPPVTRTREQKGTVTYVDEGNNEGYVRVNNYGPEIDVGWRGATITKQVPVDSNGNYAENWTCNYRFDFNTDGALDDRVANSQLGHNSVTFVDQNDDIICSVVIEDNNKSKQRSDLAIYMKDKRVWDTRETTNFYVTGRENDQTGVKVVKFGNTITFTLNFGNVLKSFTTDFTEGTQLKKVTWYGAVYGKGNPPITNNNLRALHIVKHNVQKYEDIPNTFQPGDKVTLDFSKGDGDIKVNGFPSLKIGAIGNNYFSLKPGDNIITCLWSDWATNPPKIAFKHRGEYV